MINSNEVIKDTVEQFINKLRTDKNIFTFEIAPPAKSYLNEIILDIKKSGIENYIDAFVVVDAPFAKLRTSSILASIRLSQAIDKPFIATLTLRDRNSIALQSDIIGANSFDIRMILAVTGDSIKLGNQQQAKKVFEGNSAYLVKIINKLNHDMSIAGYEIGSDLKPIYPFCVINSYSESDFHLEQALSKKALSGVLAIFTQPVFEKERLLKMLDWLHAVPMPNAPPLIAGFFPVFSYKTAYFLYSKLPGAYIPTEWLHKLQKASEIGASEEKKVGIELSQQLFSDLMNVHGKLHIMCMNNHAAVVDILKNVT